MPGAPHLIVAKPIHHNSRILIHMGLSHNVHDDNGNPLFLWYLLDNCTWPAWYLHVGRTYHLLHGPAYHPMPDDFQATPYQQIYIFQMKNNMAQLYVNTPALDPPTTWAVYCSHTLGQANALYCSALDLSYVEHQSDPADLMRIAKHSLPDPKCKL